MQNTVQNQNSIRMGSGILKLDDVNIGAIMSSSLDVSFLTAQLKFANAKLPPRNKIDQVVFNAEIVELDLKTLNKIFGGELSAVDGEGNTDNPGKARQILTFDDFLKIIDMYEVTFENTDSDGKKFGIKIYKGYATSNLSFTNPNDDDLETVSSIPVEFHGYPNEDNKFFEIFDEQAYTPTP